MHLENLLLNGRQLLWIEFMAKRIDDSVFGLISERQLEQKWQSRLDFPFLSIVDMVIWIWLWLRYVGSVSVARVVAKEHFT